MKNLKTLFILLSAMLFFTACKKEESSKLRTISGEVRMQDAQIPEITTPLEGITVYLLNAPFTIDTLTNWFTKTDILDSVQTNANGFYEFSQLNVGNYVVLPADTTAEYRFEWSENSDPLMISSTNSQMEFTVNFITPEPIVENSGEYFEFKFNNQNACAIWGDAKGEATGKNIKIFRTTRVWTIIEWHWWGPEFGWGDWYWSEVSGYGYIVHQGLVMGPAAWHDWEHFSMRFSKDINVWRVDYKDEFHIKFYIGGTLDPESNSYMVVPFLFPLKWKKTITLSGETLKDTNEFDVDWLGDNVVVNRID